MATEEEEEEEGKVSEEQGGFRKGGGCIDQIFAMKRLGEEYLGKTKDDKNVTSMV